MDVADGSLVAAGAWHVVLGRRTHFYKLRGGNEESSQEMRGAMPVRAGSTCRAVCMPINAD